MECSKHAVCPVVDRHVVVDEARAANLMAHFGNMVSKLPHEGKQGSVFGCVHFCKLEENKNVGEFAKTFDPVRDVVAYLGMGHVLHVFVGLSQHVYHMLAEVCRVCKAREVPSVK